MGVLGKIGHFIKVVVLDVEHGLVKLFGKHVIEDFLSAAENLLATDAGEEITALGQKAVANATAGATAISILEGLGKDILSFFTGQGVTIAEEVAQLLAGLVLAKLKGSAPAPAPGAGQAATS